MNYLEKNNFMLCDDRTGVMLNGAQRVDAVTTLQIVHEVYGIIQKTVEPRVQTLEVHFALRTLCVHFGWAPSDIAVVEQYAALGAAAVGGSAPTTG